MLQAQSHNGSCSAAEPAFVRINDAYQRVSYQKAPTNFQYIT